MPADTRLQKAIELANDFWFPANPELLTRIRTGLKNGALGSDVHTLVSEIRSDFSLFTYCLRELLLTLKREHTSVPSELGPLEILEWSGTERLQKILLAENSSISRHSLKGISAVQTSRFREALTSASTVELLSASYGIDPLTGYSTALLRQLGYTLIAWNYPRVYEKLVLNPRADIPLDLAISQTLGFSPSLLAATMLREWGLPVQLVAAVAAGSEDLSDPFSPRNFSAETEFSEGSDRPQIALSISTTLNQLCRVGEALARANDPDHYPSARSDWNFARDAIEQALGPEGMTAIQERLVDNCDSYLASAPHVFRGGLILDPEQQIAMFVARTTLERNPYLEHCSDEIRLAFEQLYERIRSDPKPRLKENLGYVLKEITSLVGFTGGIVFTIDPAMSLFVPQAKIGTLRTRKYSPVTYAPYTASEEQINNAFKAKDAIIETREVHVQDSSRSEQIGCFAGVLGHSQRYGVLFLETPYDTPIRSEAELVYGFRAISQALTDILG